MLIYLAFAPLNSYRSRLDSITSDNWSWSLSISMSLCISVFILFILSKIFAMFAKRFGFNCHLFRVDIWYLKLMLHLFINNLFAYLMNSKLTCPLRLINSLLPRDDWIVMQAYLICKHICLWCRFWIRCQPRITAKSTAVYLTGTFFNIDPF